MKRLEMASRLERGISPGDGCLRLPYTDNRHSIASDGRTGSDKARWRRIAPSGHGSAGPAGRVSAGGRAGSAAMDHAAHPSRFALPDQPRAATVPVTAG